MKSFNTIGSMAFAVCLALSLAGCGGGKPATTTDAPKSAETKPATPAAKVLWNPTSKPETIPNLFVSAALPDAKDVEEIKKTAKEGDVVTIRGVIGGRKEAFTAGRAQMIIASATNKEMIACNFRPGDECPYPWDFCCVPRSTIVAGTATIQVLDETGKPRKVALENMEGLSPLSVVVVKGTVDKRDDPAVLTVNASQIHIEKRFDWVASK